MTWQILYLPFSPNFILILTIGDLFNALLITACRKLLFFYIAAIFAIIWATESEKTEGSMSISYYYNAEVSNNTVTYFPCSPDALWVTVWTCIKHSLHELLLCRLKSNRYQEKCLQVLERNNYRPVLVASSAALCTLLEWFFGRGWWAPCSFCWRVGFLTFFDVTFLQLQQNLAQPRKRPRSFLLPTIVRPSKGMCGTYLCLGANNGDRALSSIVQVSAMSSQSSCSAQGWVGSPPFPS